MLGFYNWVGCQVGGSREHLTPVDACGISHGLGLFQHLQAGQDTLGQGVLAGQALHVGRGIWACEQERGSDPGYGAARAHACFAHLPRTTTIWVVFYSSRSNRL